MKYAVLLLSLSAFQQYSHAGQATILTTTMSSPETVMEHHFSSNTVNLNDAQKSDKVVNINSSTSTIVLPQLIDGKYSEADFKSGIEVSLLPDASCQIKEYSIVEESFTNAKNESSMNPIQVVSTFKEGCHVTLSDDGNSATVDVDLKRPVLKKYSPFIKNILPVAKLTTS